MELSINYFETLSSLQFGRGMAHLSDSRTANGGDMLEGLKNETCKM